MFLFVFFKGDLYFFVVDLEVVYVYGELEIEGFLFDLIVVVFCLGYFLVKDKVLDFDVVWDCLRIGVFIVLRFEWWRMESGWSEGCGFVMFLFVCDNYEVLVCLVEFSDVIVFGLKILFKFYVCDGCFKVMFWFFEGLEV